MAKYWWIGIAFVQATGCAYLSPTDQRLTDMAGEYCQCTAKLAELNHAAANFAASSQPDDDLSDRFQALEQEYASAKECTAGLLKQYGALTEEDLVEITAILQKKCPAMAEKRELLRELLGP